jgi:hypothetical protein
VTSQAWGSPIAPVVSQRFTISHAAVDAALWCARHSSRPVEPTRFDTPRTAAKGMLCSAHALAKAKTYLEVLERAAGGGTDLRRQDVVGRDDEGVGRVDVRRLPGSQT